MATAKKSEDPTISTESVSTEDDGTHEARPISETHHAASRLKYKDNPDKPDPTTVAQIVEIPEDWS